MHYSLPCWTKCSREAMWFNSCYYNLTGGAENERTVDTILQNLVSRESCGNTLFWMVSTSISRYYFSIRVLKKYLNRTEQFCLLVGISVSTTRRKKLVSQNSIYFWIRSVINHTYETATGSVCESVKVKAHVLQKLGVSLLFK